jgi:hypothetical protein
MYPAIPKGNQPQPGSAEMNLFRHDAALDHSGDQLGGHSLRRRLPFPPGRLC